MQDWLWHCARWKKEVQAEKWPGNATARGEFLQPLLRLQRSIATLPLLSKELSVTLFLSLILNYKYINSRTETVWKTKTEDSITSVWIQIGKIEGPLWIHMMRGFNVRNEQGAGPVREDPTQNPNLVRKLGILKSLLKFLHISETPGHLLLMFSICSSHVGVILKKSTWTPLQTLDLPRHCPVPLSLWISKSYSRVSLCLILT